jgi:23S rRNA-/tRNA-specific pseudouridylate synthase
VGTGGLVLVGKTRRGAARLSAQLAAREVRKEYAAVVVGAVPRAGRVELPLSGQACATAFEPLRAARSVEHGTLTLMRLWPLTGRKHQLRRHMAALGHPILGDKSLNPPSPARAARLANCAPAPLRPRYGAAARADGAGRVGGGRKFRGERRVVGGLYLWAVIFPTLL